MQITSDTLFSELPLIRGNYLWQNHLVIYGALAALLLTVTAARIHYLFRKRI